MKTEDYDKTKGHVKEDVQRSEIPQQSVQEQMRNHLRIILRCACGFIILGVALYLVARAQGFHHAKESYQELAESHHAKGDVNVSQNGADAALASLDRTTEDGLDAQGNPKIPLSGRPYQSPIDFDDLVALNPDIYAWIAIPELGIDYPIVQSAEDDLYYLDHDAMGAHSNAGAIFSQVANQKDFSDPVTILYGHHLRAGGMFTSLLTLPDPQVWDAWDRNFTVYLPMQEIHYHIVGAMGFDDRHLLESYDFSHDWEVTSFLQEAYNYRSLSKVWEENKRIEADEDILVLSTCGGRDNQRFLSIAVRVDD